MTAITRRPPIVGRYTFEELALAWRNAGMPLEALRHDVTPIGLHYQLIHFDIPSPDVPGWRLRLVVPRWYGMASVKWLERIEAIEGEFDGVQQAHSYRFRTASGATRAWNPRLRRTPGTCGGRAGTPRRERTRSPAARPTPRATCSRSSRRGTSRDSATMRYSGSRCAWPSLESAPL